MGKVPPQQTVIVMTVAVTIVMWISTTLAMVMIPQATYAQQDEGNPSFSSSSSFNNCASDQLPVSINGEIQCLRQGECYSEQFEGNEVKHCNFMMSNSDE